MSAYTAHMDARRLARQMNRVDDLAQLIDAHANEALQRAGMKAQGQHDVAVSAGLVDAMVMELERALAGYRSVRTNLPLDDLEAAETYVWGQRPVAAR